MFEKCQTCHRATGWNKVNFNHNKKTKFKLAGAHKKALCQSCHINQKYTKTPKKCISCHKIDDVHRGKNGNKWMKLRVPNNARLSLPKWQQDLIIKLANDKTQHSHDCLDDAKNIMWQWLYLLDVIDSNDKLKKLKDYQDKWLPYVNYASYPVALFTIGKYITKWKR